MKKEEIATKLEDIFGKGSSQELVKATIREKTIEAVEEKTKREA